MGQVSEILTGLRAAPPVRKPVDLARTPASISVVVSVCNLQVNIPELGRRLLPVLRSLGRAFEGVFVSAGSKDRSWTELEKLAADRPRVKAVDPKRNSGQTAALMCPLDHATGGIIGTVRTYFESQDKHPYTVRARINVRVG